MVRQIPSSEQFPSSISSFSRDYRIATLLRQLRVAKQAGIPAIRLFKFLLALVFSGRSLSWNLDQQRTSGFCKDTLYRFLNAPGHNWRRFLLLLAQGVITRMQLLTSEDRADVLVWMTLCTVAIGAKKSNCWLGSTIIQLIASCEGFGC